MGQVLGAIRRHGALSSALFCAAVGCASHASTPSDLADRITRAIYSNDYDGTVANFDDGTKRAVTRTDVGALSDRMHALGALKTVTQRSGDADSGRYEFDAAFTAGVMVVRLRIDPSGRVGAYRITPVDTSAPPKASTQG
ncbi:MAG: hypothetical protein NVS2B8_07900 [Vulcanimicrobiaceae bacterium]